ncbi:Mitochondrial amidoxime reducing component 2 [Blattella germanica]|nr:Mitochondrial amidoxime reducing component 2 [Blattella germanica]
MAVQFPSLSQNALLWGTTVIVATYAIYWLKQRKSHSVPTKWKKVGEVSELIMYPLKSGRGEQLKEADCTELGLKTTEDSPNEIRHLRDRTFIIYNPEAGTFITCRQFTSLLLVRITSAGENAVTFTAPGMTPLKLKLPEPNSKINKFSMWFGEELKALDCGDEAANWICKYLKKEGDPMRVGFHKPEIYDTRRNTDKPPWIKFKKYYKRLRSDYTGAFADLASYMLLSESSLNDLKTRLPEHLQNIPAQQFRPNIVVRGSNPYEEDKWDWIKFGDSIVMQGFKPCTRFRQVTDPGAKELEGDAPVMGLYMGLHTTGRLKVGDPVYIGLS